MKPRHLVVIAAVIAVVGSVLTWLAADPRVNERFANDFSTFNRGDNGLSVAHEYLQKRNRKGVSILTRSIDDEELPASAVVLRIAPEAEPFLPLENLENGKEKEAYRTFITPAEEAWIAGGGRLVLAPSQAYGPITTTEERGSKVTKVFPLWRDVPTLEPPLQRTFIPNAALGHAIFLQGGEPLITRARLGAGDIFFIAAPELFTNDKIRNRHHLALLEALTAERPVLFDEASHGIRSDAGLVELLKRAHLGPFLLLALLTFSLRFWRSSKRIGPADPEHDDLRSEAVDLVGSIAALYERGYTRRDAIEEYRKSFSAAVEHQTLLHGEELERKVKELAGDKPASSTRDLTHGEFQTELARLNEGFGRLEHARHR